MGRKFACVFCKRSEESKVTGSLLTKDAVTAHQFCLLYSSGIFCQDSPGSDDLFGFSVEDVKKEVVRGVKLKCARCKTWGATAGCEVKRCQKSYHYPCAIEIGAKAIEDGTGGKYGIYCPRHGQKENSGTFQTSRPSSIKAGPSKKIKNGGFAAAGLSSVSSDSGSSRSAKSGSVKKRPIRNDQQEESPSKRKPEAWNKIISDDSASSGDEQLKANMEIFAPIEFDLEENGNAAAERPVDVPPSERKITDSSAAPTTGEGDHHSDGSAGGNEDADETFILSEEEESESLLPPVDARLDSPPPGSSQAEQASQTLQFLLGRLKSEHESDGTYYDVPAARAKPPPGSSEAPRPGASSARHPPPGPVGVSSPASPPCAPAPPSNPEPHMTSCSFWKNCNAAGCTQPIFRDFIDQMKDVGRRIQSEEASQEDYDLALAVMEASGKLAAMVAKQQEELREKQTALQKAAAAIAQVVSALEKRT